MKGLIKSIIIFATGAGIGFLSANFILKSRYERIAQEEIDSVKEIFKRTSAERLSKTIKTADDIAKKTKNPAGIFTRNSMDEKTPYGTVITKYHEMAKDDIRKRWDNEAERAKEMSEDEDIEEYEEDPDAPITDSAGYSESDHLDEQTERDLTKIDRTKPYVISDVEFSEEFDHHDKLSLYYYTLDDILCDENERLVEDIDGVISYPIMSTLDMYNTVWVRNEPLAADFEICVIRSSYAEMVHGIIPDDPHQKNHKTKKKYDDE